MGLVVSLGHIKYLSGRERIKEFSSFLENRELFFTPNIFQNRIFGKKSSLHYLVRNEYGQHIQTNTDCHSGFVGLITEPPSLPSLSHPYSFDSSADAKGTRIVKVPCDDEVLIKFCWTITPSFYQLSYSMKLEDVFETLPNNLKESIVFNFDIFL